MNSKRASSLVTPFVIWFTGLPCSGKTTLATALREYLNSCGITAEYLDGDEVRKIVPALGFSCEQRNAHIRQMGFLASRMVHHGIPVIASFVSPYEESRTFCRALCPHFIEVHVATPLAICEQRDDKGMYKLARAGKLPQFTGVDDQYHPPQNAELRIDTTEATVEDLTRLLIEYLSRHNFLKTQQ